MYLTPGRYRNMALGVDLSEKSDAELASLIASATAEVNRHCAAPRGHDFRGGSITREQHLWNTGNSHQPSSGRLWPFHGMGVMPLISCSRIDIYTTMTNYIRFDSSNIFVQGALGYVEPVAAPITTALFTSVPPWLMTSPQAYIDYDYGLEFTVTDEPIFNTDGSARLVYRATNQFWTSAAVTVKKNGSVITTGFTLDRTEGTVTFGSAQGASDTFTASYTHSLPTEIALATGIQVTEMLGYSNINASGLGGLSGIKVEEIELRQSTRAGFSNVDLHPAAKKFLGSYVYASWG